MIFDTDVLIWFLRGNDKAVDAVVNAIPFAVSAVTYMELLQDMRNRREMKTMKSSFREMGVEVTPIDEHISSKAVDLVEQYTLSHSMELADALIASTCTERGEKLFTANDKHYKMIDELRIEVFRP